jgi:hypothetical protein
VAADRLGQLTDEIALRTLLVGGAMRIGDRAGPEREAVVVLRGQNHVSGSRLGEELAPLLGPPLLDLLIKGRKEVRVLVLLAISRAVVPVGRRPGYTHTVHVPLSVGVHLEELVASELTVLALRLSL